MYNQCTARDNEGKPWCFVSDNKGTGDEREKHLCERATCGNGEIHSITYLHFLSNMSYTSRGKSTVHRHLSTPNPTAHVHMTKVSSGDFKMMTW